MHPAHTHTPDAAPPKAVAERDAARLISMSVHYLRQARVQGRGPDYMRFGRSIRYSLDALDKFMQTRTVRNGAA